MLAYSFLLYHYFEIFDLCNIIIDRTVQLTMIYIGNMLNMQTRVVIKKKILTNFFCFFFFTIIQSNKLCKPALDKLRFIMFFTDLNKISVQCRLLYINDI